MYKLKTGVQSFTVVDGEFAGKRYDPGIIYSEIPPQEKSKFEKIPEDPAPAKSTATKPGLIEKAEALASAAPEKTEV